MEKKFDIKLISVAYIFLGVVFLIAAVLTFFISLLYFYKITPVKPFLFFGYAVFGFLFSYGFLMLKKWIVPLLALNFLSVAIVDLNALLNFGAKINISMLVSLLASFALFYFAYATRKYLIGSFVKLRPMILFGFFWVVIMVASFNMLSDKNSADKKQNQQNNYEVKFYNL